MAAEEAKKVEVPPVCATEPPPAKVETKAPEEKSTNDTKDVAVVESKFCSINDSCSHKHFSIIIVLFDKYILTHDSLLFADILEPVEAAEEKAAEGSAHRGDIYDLVSYFRNRNMVLKFWN